jgi:hypothetical protein
MLLVSCGGVDSGGTGTYASGPITGYGSIIVGGVHYDESSALVEDETGAARTPDELQLGMVTEIEALTPDSSASMPTATAMAVRFRSEIIGPVDAVDAVAGTLRVLGQSIKVGPTTVFDARLAGGLAALKVGDIVEVYGQLDISAKRYTATRIEPRVAGAQNKLRGLVTAVNAVAKTFVIGWQTIDYGKLAGALTPAVGQLLRVELEPAKVNGVWVAVSIEVGTRKIPDRDKVEVEGRITSFTSTASFEVDGIPVETDDSTSFPDGVSAIALGARVDVEGSSLDGKLTATKVSIESDDHGGSSPFELSGTIKSLNAGAQTFVLRGFTVHWSDSTRFESSSVSSLRNDRKVEVKGALSTDGTRLEASLIHVELGD